MYDFAFIVGRPNSRVIYASGLPLEYEALKPLSPVTALGGCSWSVHPASLLPLPSSQDGSTGMKGTQLIITWRTCRQWPAVGLPLMLVVRRYACTVIYDVWQCVKCIPQGDLSPIHLLKEWYINTNTVRTIPKKEFQAWQTMVSRVTMYTLAYEVTCMGGLKSKWEIMLYDS